MNPKLVISCDNNLSIIYQFNQLTKIKELIVKTNKTYNKNKE
jgi:hypothetical protein